MNDLDKLFDGFKAGRMKYPQPRRESEDVFFGELVARIKAIEARLSPDGMIADLEARFAPFEKAIDTGMWPTPDGAKSDRMAAARAAKAAKREEAAV